MNPFLTDERWGVDWVRVIANIRATGLSHASIAARVFVAKGSIDAYGSEDMRQRPEHSTGERLIALWCEVLGYARADLPMYRRGISVSEMLRSSR